MLNNFINSLMYFVSVVMVFSGMAMFVYAVVGGYYHYSPLFHAVGWGFGGWILFFVGKDWLAQYKPAEQQTLPVQPERPMPYPVSPHASRARNANRLPPRRPWSPLDDQHLDD